ncbi:hypothetical protein DUI87_21406 [Hirundo rustica rustica]|uniref:Uncharacterized protein n=1 Tax=Hirundo rustica rustica TaxID=333673 RepID=A0A3M0JMZ3_HIRRU|nr:hypothetical protein DUI87_21406 [Hirundo rustica rustica]
MLIAALADERLCRDQARSRPCPLGSAALELVMRRVTPGSSRQNAETECRQDQLGQRIMEYPEVEGVMEDPPQASWSPTPDPAQDNPKSVETELDGLWD